MLDNEYDTPPKTKAVIKETAYDNVPSKAVAIQAERVFLHAKEVHHQATKLENRCDESMWMARVVDPILTSLECEDGKGGIEALIMYVSSLRIYDQALK